MNQITAQWRRTPMPRLQESYTIQKKTINNNNNIKIIIGVFKGGLLTIDFQ